MTEFELHQLAIQSRSEFDAATVIYMAWAFAFLVLCRDREARWTRGEGIGVGLVYLLGCGLLVVRCVASMVRYGRELALLHSFDSFAILSNPGGMWIVTLVLRYAFLAAATIVPLYFVRRKCRT